MEFCPRNHINSNDPRLFLHPGQSEIFNPQFHIVIARNQGDPRSHQSSPPQKKKIHGRLARITCNNLALQGVKGPFFSCGITFSDFHGKSTPSQGWKSEGLKKGSPLLSECFSLDPPFGVKKISPKRSVFGG